MSRSTRGVFRVVVGLLIALGLLGTLGLVGFLGWERSKRAELDAQLEPLIHGRAPTLVQVVDAEGRPFDRFGVQRRFRVPIEEVSPHVVEALIAAEDRRFWRHQGVDSVGIARAALANAQAGTVVEGGSTLTQQLVKATLLEPERSLSRKVEEALLARRLEARMDKRTLLERYLNTVYFGRGNYGVEAAARDYFGVHASELDLAQAALLVAMIPAPSAYAPHRHPEEARAQRSRVLGDLEQVGLIDRSTREALDAIPLLPADSPDEIEEEGTGVAYRTAVRREIRELFGKAVASEIGMVVQTPYEPELQRWTERSLREGIDALYDRYGRFEVQGRITGRTELASFLERARGLRRAADGTPMVPEVGDCFPAMVQRPWRPLRVGPYEVELATDAWSSVVRDPEQWRTVASLPWGSLLDVCIDADEGPHLQPSDWLTGAAVVIDNKTGGVLALASGRGMQLEGFNQATQARRQPGSTFKPYVYGAALEQGRTQLDIELDAPVTIGRWSPRNAGGYSGPLTLRTALTWSRNTVAARLINQTGAAPVQRLAHAAGIESEIRRDLTIALGSSEVTLLEHAGGYSTLARNGQAIAPNYIRAIRDDTGRTLAEAGERVQLAAEDVELPGAAEPAMSPATAAQLVDMLQSVVQRGTGRRAFDPERARAGKTGTTSDYVEGWFMGFTPQHTIGVWVGSRDREPMGPKAYGSRTALPVWVRIADFLDDPSDRFLLPPEVYLEDVHGELIVMPRTEGDDRAEDTAELPPFPGHVASR